MNLHSPECSDDARLGVGEAARLIGMSRRQFYEYTRRNVRDGGCRYVIPPNSTRKVILGKWLRDFYRTKTGFIGEAWETDGIRPP